MAFRVSLLLFGKWYLQLALCQYSLIPFEQVGQNLVFRNQGPFFNNFAIFRKMSEGLK